MAQSKKSTTKVSDKTIEDVLEANKISTNVCDVKTSSDSSKSENIKKPRKFQQTDLIPCTNIFAGTTIMIGQKSGIMYTWGEMGQTEDVEYQDVIAEVLKKSSCYIYEPLIIIEDPEFLEQRPDLKRLYDKMYSPSELEHILNMSSPENMRNVIINLPKGVKESVKNLAATMIQKGTLDSVKKIKIIDEIFGTKLMMQTELFLK